MVICRRVRLQERVGNHPNRPSMGYGSPRRCRDNQRSKEWSSRPGFRSGPANGSHSKGHVLGGRSSVWIGSGGHRFGIWFAAVELADDIRPYGPGCDFRALRLLALAVGNLVSRTDQTSFDKHMRAFLDGGQDMFGEPWPENRDAVPFDL